MLAANGDAEGKLSYLCKKHMMMRASNIHTLNRGGSYLSVWRGGKVALELIDNDQPVAVGSSDAVVIDSRGRVKTQAVFSTVR